MLPFLALRRRTCRHFCGQPRALECTRTSHQIISAALQCQSANARCFFSSDGTCTIYLEEDDPVRAFSKECHDIINSTLIQCRDDAIRNIFGAYNIDFLFEKGCNEYGCGSSIDLSGSIFEIEGCKYISGGFLMMTRTGDLYYVGSISFTKYCYKIGE